MSHTTPLGDHIEMRFYVDEIDESSLIHGRNDRVDIPVGAVFTTIGKMRLNDKTTWTSTDLGSVESIQLTLLTVHWYRREIDCIPGGHSAGIAVTGDGLDLLANQISQLSDGESVYLVVT